ncbi:hypothetical protein A1QO_02585 [Vibrio genomosp. F10 str. ZF-129]|uniref:Uncharacterized protein n=1 Tax=Vibrio genomosp. F10 str. ZF-129 TaxID=1187848 RepID=A0A1E5BK97_9VIBR|nr:hypothetical protein [Vibrio genomosp. F10]OEE38284.1 hypothetical protein A1QO_02585 [Vibrio genomosp. F10 str. ZF-129]
MIAGKHEPSIGVVMLVRLSTLMTALLLSTGSLAGDSTTPVPSTLSQDANFSQAGASWEAHWSGNTSGNIGIPSTANTVFIQSDIDTVILPKNTSATFGGVVSASKNLGKCTITVSASGLGYFNGSTVRGGSRSVPGRCEYSYHTGNGGYTTRYLDGSATVVYRLRKVMVQ